MSASADRGAAALPTQAEGLEASEVADGLVLYQADVERVHYLNTTAAIVFELCTGANSVDDITRLLGDAFSLDEPPAAEVRRCLDHLRSQGVVI